MAEEDDYSNDEETHSESGSESDIEETPPPKPAEKPAVYNIDGLLEKLEEIAMPANLDWIEKLNIDLEQPQEVDVNDDLAREMAFYTQALDATRQAFERLQSMEVPFLRPPDYYAEMLKSDSHMLKVKGRLLSEKKRVEEAEERKKAREAKKIAKEVQAQKTKERGRRKKEEIDSVKRWRKQRQQSGFAKGKDEEAGLGFDDDGRSFETPGKRRPGVAPGDRSGGFGRRGGRAKGGQGQNKKRQGKESRFGYGGRKGMRKQNTAETTDDLRGLNKGGLEGNKKRKR